MLLGLDRAAAAEFSFFLAMPTMAGGVRPRPAARCATSWRRSAPVEIAIGFVMAFRRGAGRGQAVPALRDAVGLRAVRLVPDRARAWRSWRRIGGGLAVIAVAAARASSPASSSRVPLVVSVAALVWIFGIIDGFTAPLSRRGYWAGDGARASGILDHAAGRAGRRAPSRPTSSAGACWRAPRAG